MEKAQLIQRWDVFLQKIEQRFNDALTHAEQACTEQLEETDYDYYTVFRSWQGMKAQISNLINQIDTTWYDKVQPQMKAVGDFYTEEGNKASDTNDKLVDHLQHFETLLEGKLSQAYYNHAIAIGFQDFHCSQCDAKLKIKRDLYRAQYVTCHYCNTVNTFEPEAKFMHIGWNIVDNIATIKVLDKHAKKEQAFAAIQQAKANKAQSLHLLWDSYKSAYFDYYESYFKERIKLKPSAQERYDDDIKRKTKEYEDIEKIHRYNAFGIK